jgi:predicted nucleic acid-binding protein
MLVVSDTSPVTSLVQVGQGGLLPALFDRVLIPQAVGDELLRYHTALPDYLEIRTIQDRRAVDDLHRVLDLGESEAIVLAGECEAQFLLMDEKRGRLVATSRGLAVIGLLGVLLLVKKAGHVHSVRSLVDELHTKAGFFVSDAVRMAALRAAGEGP